MNTVMDGAGVDLKDQVEPGQCAGEPISNCKKKKPIICQPNVRTLIITVTKTMKIIRAKLQMFV